MDNLIERNDVIDYLRNEVSLGTFMKRTIGKADEACWSICNGIITKVPTVDAESVRHGKWIPCAKSGLVLTEQMRAEGIRWYGFKCSACNFIRKGNAPREANYCECCGARMDEE